MTLSVEIIPILETNYTYIIKSGRHVSVVDPGDVAPVIAALEKGNDRLDWIINTHRHSDHIAGNDDLVARYGAQVAAPDECSQADIILRDGDVFSFGDINFQIIATPGHTMGHIVLHDPESAVLFSGDTLFAMGCGRVFEGTMQQMYESLLRLKSLPPETKIYCGHEYTADNAQFALHIMPDNQEIARRAKEVQEHECTMPTTLGQELKTNPYFLAQDGDDFTRIRKAKDLY